MGYFLLSYVTETYQIIFTRRKSFLVSLEKKKKKQNTVTKEQILLYEGHENLCKIKI